MRDKPSLQVCALKLQNRKLRFLKMIFSPYRAKINSVKDEFNIAIKEKNYEIAKKKADELSILYMNEVKYHSGFICDLEKILENRDKQSLLEKFKSMQFFFVPDSFFNKHIFIQTIEKSIQEETDELTQTNKEWKKMLDIQEHYSIYKNF